MITRTLASAVAAVLVITACGGGDDSSLTSDSGSGAADPAIADGSPSSGADVGLPEIRSDFAQVCTDGTSFDGANVYDASATGPHPVALFRRSNFDESFMGQFVTLPDGWEHEFDDEDLARVELVSCLDIVERTPTGTICDFEADDGSTDSLELVDISFSLAVRSARTGEVVGEDTIDATTTSCPGFAMIADDQTQYFAAPSADQMTIALRDLVAPAGGGADDVPRFLSDLNRLCTTQVGFAGLTPLTDGPGPRPIQVFQESGDFFVRSTADLPTGWEVDEDDDSEDSTDLVPIELVACTAIGAEVSTGVVCSLEADDGTVTELDLVDVTYDVTVYEAATGAEVGTAPIEVPGSECPSFAFVDPDQTTYSETPDAEQLVTVLTAFVTPT